MNTTDLSTLPVNIRKLIQKGLQASGLYNGAIDGIFGPMTKLGLESYDRAHPNVVVAPMPKQKHEVIATSFADPADIAAFKKCKAQGGTDKECFKVGDNGVGLWGDSTEEGTGPCCALPPEDWQHLTNPARTKVLVEFNGLSIICELRDTMPHKANITNGAGIDLNPDAVKSIGLKPPIKARVIWSFV